MSESVAEQMNLLRDEWREVLRQELIDEGWTPPPEKPEPEFKVGQPVEVRHGGGKWVLGTFANEVPGGCFQASGSGVLWGECRPAPTHIKWEDGQSPVPSGTKGTVFSNTSRPYIKMNDGRWAWMSQEE